MTLTNQKTSVLILAPGYSIDFKEHLGMIVCNEGCQAFFSPFGFPVHGNYDDYGYIENVIRDKNVEMLEAYFGVGIDDILNNIGDDRSIPKNIKHEEFYKTLGKTYFRTEILEHLEKGWDSLIIENPAKYSASERMKNLLKTIDKKNNDKIDESKRIELLDKLVKKTITEDEKDILFDSVHFSSGYEFTQQTYIAGPVKNNMFTELPITTDFKDFILKQYSMINALSRLAKNLVPSNYGTQEDNWVELYHLNDVVNDLLASDIKERSDRWGDDMQDVEKDVVRMHKAVKRDRKLNMLIDPIE